MKRWLKLDANWPHGHTAKKLKERFGRDGQVCWVNALAAAKRNTPEGELSYTSDAHFWNQVGLLGEEPDFTVTEFFRYLGQLHLTSKRRSGDVITIVFRRWDDWQTEWRREDDRERKSSKRRETNADTLRTANGHRPDKKRTEREIEKEKERESKNGLIQVLSDLGEVDPERLQKMLTAYPDRDHFAEAVRMVDWTTEKGIERKDVVKAYGNWLARANPATASSEPFYPRLTEPV